ncbi:MAG: murein biosynthesis integral membrane protein MurJ [Gemmatimonadota bacterium]|nr:murein biosynthesis integral membrane protein MurJ [Gemmatimonadota bacterium]
MAAEPRAHPNDDHRAPRKHTGAAAFVVALGIFGSRVLGLVRQSLVARYLGATIASDAWVMAFKIPNVLQNLFGEGALSAAFIPVYARLIARGEDEAADRLAGAVAAMLAVVVSVIVLAGIAAAPLLTYVIAPGFTGEKRALTVELVRILFPGMGLLVLFAWGLGVLNSHRRFLVSYTAPMAWNVVMIAGLLWWGRDADKGHVVTMVAWASVVGSLFQFLFTVPSVRAVAPHVRIAFDSGSEHVRAVFRAFGPAFLSRGVVQISSFVDQILTSLLPNGAVAIFGYAFTLYLLPVSLFGTSVSVAELPEMSRVAHDGDEAASMLRGRIDAGLRRIAFLVVPSAVAFVAIGDVMVRLIFQHGEFTALDTVYTWAVLCGSAVGLLAGTLGRLYSSTYYALRDTRTPLRFAVVRLLLTTLLGAAFALLVPRMLGIDPRWGVAGLSASAGVAAWVEFLLLRSRLNRRIGSTGLSGRYAATLWGLAVASAGVAVLVQRATLAWRPMVAGILVIAVYGTAYLGGAMALQVREARGVLGGLGRRFRPAR